MRTVGVYIECNYRHFLIHGFLNYFIKGNNIKLQTDVTKVSEAPISSSTYSLANVNDDALIWRIKLGFAY